jgi:hypothetical protein
MPFKSLMVRRISIRISIRRAICIQRWAAGGFGLRSISQPFGSFPLPAKNRLTFPFGNFTICHLENDFQHQGNLAPQCWMPFRIRN